MSTGRFTDDLRRLMARSYDTCQSCGSKLPREISAYAGYAVDASPLYVGECCRHLINELAIDVYWWWESDKRCPPDTVPWRYLDFAKFVALIEDRSVYFSRADKLGDRFEGASGISDRRMQWDAFYLDFFRQSIRTAPGRTEQFPIEQIEEQAQRLLQELSLGAEQDRQSSFVSCWHANTGESEALWRLYCPPPVTGVAIRTTAASLIDATDDDPQIRLGRVQYIDFRQQFSGIHDRIFWKRKSLSHEAEVRAVMLRRDRQDDSGLSMPVDLQKLLLAVVPSPFAPQWFENLVQALMRRLHLDSRVVRSELLSEPFF